MGKPVAIMAENAPTRTPEEIAKEYDLLPKLVTHLDRHLIFPLLQFLEGQDEEEPSEDVTRTKYELLKKTNMTDYVASLYCELEGLEDAPAEFATKRQEVLDRLDKYSEESEKITDLLSREDVVTGLRSDKVANLEVAMEEVQKVKESIDTKLFSNPLAQLTHRTWLIHWALFPFFNYEAGRDTICELFFSAPFINTIQTACPWILRYLTAAVITNRNRTRNTGQYQKQLKDIIRIVKQENYEYQDPVTDFIKALYIDFDFEEAQKKLSEAEEVLRSDFFLVSAADSFVEAARHLISESYCKVHQRIDIKDLSARLGLNQDEGEKWIVNLIRDTRVDAKIDYKEGTVVMNHPPSSVYQQVIERTKGGFFRTQVLSAAVAK